MVDDFGRELKSILEFFGIKYTDSEIEAVSEWCEFDNLQQLACQGKLDLDNMAPQDLDNPESFRFRVGKVGGYVNYLSDEDIEYINQIYKTRGFRYERTEDPEP